MKWQKKQRPSYGETRTKTGFLWFPVCLEGEWRWWERATWEERFSYASLLGWEKEKWVKEIPPIVPPLSTGSVDLSHYDSFIQAHEGFDEWRKNTTVSSPEEGWLRSLIGACGPPLHVLVAENKRKPYTEHSPEVLKEIESASEQVLEAIRFLMEGHPPVKSQETSSVEQIDFALVKVELDD
jgi:hypothetical protein